MKPPISEVPLSEYSNIRTFYYPNVPLSEQRYVVMFTNCLNIQYICEVVLICKNLSFCLNTYMEFNIKMCLFYYPKIPLFEQFCPIILNMGDSTAHDSL